MDALALLEENDINWGMIYVVTKLSLDAPLDLFYFLTNLNKTGSIKFNSIYSFKRKITKLAITPEEFVEFLGAIFPVWWERRDRFPRIRPFMSFVEAIIERKGGLECAESGMCADTHMSVGPAGHYSQCGRSSDWGLMDYGHIHDNSISTVFKDPQKEMYRARQLHLKQGECKGCRLWTVCHGGCPLDSYAETGDWMRKSPLCAYRKGFIEKYFEPITGVRFEPDGPARVPGSQDRNGPRAPRTAGSDGRTVQGAAQEPPPLDQPLRRLRGHDHPFGRPEGRGRSGPAAAFLPGYPNHLRRDPQGPPRRRTDRQPAARIGGRRDRLLGSPRLRGAERPPLQDSCRYARRADAGRRKPLRAV